MHPVQIVFILICLTLLAFALLWVAGKAAERVQRRVKRFEGVRSERAPMQPSHNAPVSPVSHAGISGISMQNDAPPAPDVTERAGVIWLAGKKKVDGSWALSANAIYDLVRGNRNEVMAWVREVRAEAADDAEIVTPYAGRRTKAAYYPEEPELEYQAP